MSRELVGNIELAGLQTGFDAVRADVAKKVAYVRPPDPLITTHDGRVLTYTGVEVSPAPAAPPKGKP